MPLDDWDESLGAKVTGVAGDAAGKVEETAQGFEKTTADATGASEEGLSIFIKLAMAAVIFGGCFAFIRAYSPKKGAVAGRHGAYEKVGV